MGFKVIHGKPDKTDGLIRFAQITARHLGIDLDDVVLDTTKLVTSDEHAHAKRVQCGELNVHSTHYEVLLNNTVPDHDAAVTICHELIHVKQFKTGRLNRINNGWVWDNTFYSFSTPYNEKPWEDEAREHEIELTAAVTEEYIQLDPVGAGG